MVFGTAVTGLLLMEQERKSFEVIPIRHLRQNVGGAYNMAGEPDLLRIGPETVHSFIQFGTSDDCRTVVGIGLGQSGGLNIPPDEGNRTFFMAPGVSCAGPGAVFVGQEHTGIVKTGAEEPLYQRIGGKNLPSHHRPWKSLTTARATRRVCRRL